MHRRLYLIPLLLAWLLATGSQWDMVQTFAWGRMIVNYSQTMPLAEAVRLTFTPDNMCDLCEAVSKAEQQTDSPLSPDPGSQFSKVLLVFQPAAVFVGAAPSTLGIMPEGPLDLQGATRAPPPVPPPRGQV